MFMVDIANSRVSFGCACKSSSRCFKCPLACVNILYVHDTKTACLYMYMCKYSTVLYACVMCMCTCILE